MALRVPVMIDAQVGGVIDSHGVLDWDMVSVTVANNEECW